jgi:hypothetical protein
MGSAKKDAPEMQRRVVQSLLVCIALALALLVPVRARAAILPACDNRELISLAPVFADAPAEPVTAECDAPLMEPEDSKVAAMCDLRGASMIAPPRVHPINDDRIEAGPSCERSSSSSSPMIGPSPRDSSAIHVSLALIEHATLDSSALFPRALSEPAPAYLPVRGEARAGIEPGVYHPPR